MCLNPPTYKLPESVQILTRPSYTLVVHRTRDLTKWRDFVVLLLSLLACVFFAFSVSWIGISL